MASKKRSKNPIELKNERRDINRAKKNKRRLKQERGPRRRDWEGFTDEDTLDGGFERIMPVDENDRRREVESLLGQAPTDEDTATPPNDTLPDANIGRVVEVSSGMCRVDDHGSTLLCTLRGALLDETTGFTNVVTVGDRVEITRTGADAAVVERVLPRHSFIARPDPHDSHLQQLLVANVDQLLIVAAWRSPNIWYELIDRYLIAAGRSNVTPVICVNKIDLAEDIAQVEADLAPYRDLGYTVLLTSAEQGTGLDELREHLSGKITALAGLSGVGKSTLLSAVQPGFELRTNEVNEERGQGRHTTTQASMMPFYAGGYVIDTPGIREFGLAGLHQADLSAHFPEIATVAGGCKFANCTHTHEPGCAVQDAVAAGDVHPTRYKSYTAILAAMPG